MGALHAGHQSLVARAARPFAGAQPRVLVSVFVNPTQFGPSEDFEAYPRTLEEDRDLCAKAGADVIFHPSAEAMYPGDASISILESRLSRRLCGASRPGHFGGVCTVVAKLFLLVRPDIAVFGKKDFQQLAIIRRMVRDLNFGVKVHGVETVRELDGLAMSSRNVYLSGGERVQAAAIRRAMLGVDVGLGVEEMLAGMVERLREEAPLGVIDYLELVDAETLEGIDGVSDRPALLAAAVFFGKTRLIDNLEIAPTS